MNNIESTSENNSTENNSENNTENNSERKVDNTSIIEEFNNDFITQSYDGKLKISDSDIIEKHNIYSFNIIKTFSLIQIYKIFKSANMMVFVNENKIKFKSGFLSCFGCCYSFVVEDNIILISDKFIPSLKKILNKWNNYIYNNKIYNNKKIVDENNNTIYNVVFCDNIISKNILYYKMIIQDKIIFIPYKDYLRKKIEYKIRGFCQLMEEMGASIISIEFDSNLKKSKKIDIENVIKYNNMIAGSLGFNFNSSSLEQNNQKYDMEYPDNNNTILNKLEIEKNIKEGKFIINFDDYQSNLELQYIVNSRCNHFIHQYSTVFSITNENIMDFNLEGFLNANNIDFGQKLKVMNEYFSQTIIKTSVTFIQDNMVYNNLNSKSISLDEIGFKYLMKSLQHVNFETKGIIKINIFIENWIENKLKNLDGKSYYNIKNLINNIKKYITLNEYHKLLLNYFNNESQWIHFLNFFNILTMTTISYDKLGYIVAINIIEYKIAMVDYMINFIFQNDMMNSKVIKTIFPYDKNKNIFFNNYYLLQQEKFNNYNYDSLTSLIDYFKTLKIININDKYFLKNAFRYLKNFNKNYIYQKFYFKFIKQQLYKKYYTSKNKNYLDDDFFYYIKPNNFIDYNINCYKSFSKMIDSKFKKYNLIKEFFENKKIITDDCDLYIVKKLKIYFNSDDINNINTLIQENYNNNNNIISNILRTNNNIMFNKEICDFYSFKILKNNLHFGYKMDYQLEIFTNTIIKQIKELINENSYSYVSIDTITITPENLELLKKCDTFKDYIINLCEIINEDNIIISSKIIKFISNI